jgi:hypothetical protein
MALVLRGAGAVLAELLAFGFVVVGDRISKGGRGNMRSDGRK